MAEDKPEEAGAQGGFASIPRLYVNAVRTSFTYYDFQLMLANAALDNMGEQANLVVEPRFIVQMAPEHCKVLVSMLADQIDKYEKQFGTIRRPPTEKKPKG